LTIDQLSIVAVATAVATLSVCDLQSSAGAP
jgi:hypothetical protein